MSKYRHIKLTDSDINMVITSLLSEAKNIKDLADKVYSNNERLLADNLNSRADDHNSLAGYISKQVFDIVDLAGPE